MSKKLFLLIASIFCACSVGLRAQTSETYYFEDFESLSTLGPNKPTGWETNPMGGFSLSTGNGVENSQSFYVSLGNKDERYFYTQAMNLGTAPIVEFSYKATGIIGAASANCVRVLISVSTDDAASWKVVDSIPAGVFNGSSEIMQKRSILPSEYAGQKCRVKVSAFQNLDESCNLFIDNFAMGTPPEQKSIDLMVQSPLEGPSMPALNQESTYSLTIFNNGSEAQTDYSVKLYAENASGNTLLDSVPGTEIAAGSTLDFQLAWIPETAGKYALFAQIDIKNDEDPDNNRTETLQVEVPESGIAIELGNGNDLNNTQPFGFGDLQHISQVLYTTEEMRYMKGDILSITYEGKFARNLSSDIKVWVGETDSSNLFNSWIDPAALTLVYEGKIDFPEGDRQKINIRFDKAYDYMGKNFVIYTYNRNDSARDYTTGQFYGVYSLSTIRSVAESGTVVDIDNPSGGSPKMNRPNAILMMGEVSQERYDLVFDIRDQDGLPVEDAVITLNGTEYPVGQYEMDSLLSTAYDYKISKTGFASATGTIGLTRDTTLRVQLTKLQGIPGISTYVWEDFENVEIKHRPYKWKGDFSVEATGGIDDGKRLTQSFWFMDGPRSLTTCPVFMGENPVFEFQYRLMDYGTYPKNAFAGENLTWQIQVSTDMGKTWEILYNEDYGQHASSAEYEPFTLDVSEFANEVCMFMLYVNRDYSQNDEFYFDIDNWKIGTQSQHDLTAASPVKGPHVLGLEQEGKIDIQVRNIGKEDMDGYTLQLKQGETVIASTKGEALASGKTVSHTLSFQPDEKGDFDLTAVVTNEIDESETNNTSAPLRLNVQGEGTEAFNIPACEGEDIAYGVPYGFYYPYSLSQSLYFKDEIQIGEDDCITGIAYRSAFTIPVEKKKITVWIGETDTTNLMTYLVPVSKLQKVFEGAIDISDIDGDNLVIPFQTPYKYKGRNLVVCSYKEDVQSMPIEEDLGFYGMFNLGIVRNYTIGTDQAIDLEKPNYQHGFASFFYITTSFLTRSDIEFHKVAFSVRDGNGNNIPDAVLNFNGQVLEKGEYTVENVPDGTYAYTVSLGEASASGTVTVEGADVTETVILKNVSNENNMNDNIIRVYPNPSNGKFFVETSNDTKEIGIYNIQGRQVCKFNHVHAGTIEIDLSKEKSGIYLLMIDGKAHKITKH